MMSRIHIIFLAVILLFGHKAVSQRITIQGEIYDINNTTEVIPNAKLKKFNHKEVLAISNDKGEFSFVLEFSEQDDTLIIEHIGFEKKTIIISSSKKKKALKKDQPIKLLVGLNYNVLNQVTVQSKKIDTVYGSPTHHVEDYLINSDNSLLLLTYEKPFNKISKIVLTDANHQDIGSAVVPAEAVQLFKDFEGNSYVICTNKVFRINSIKQEIRFETVRDDDFYNFYHRVLDTIGSNYYYSTFNELYPAVSFVVTNRLDTTHHELREIKDDFMMELYRAQYKYMSGRDKLWAYRKELETGIDKEIWIGATVFTQDILYKPVYAPLFVMNDTVHIFDQYQNYIFKYDVYHNPLDSVSIDFVNVNSNEKWEQPLILDKLNNQVYGLYNKGGYYYIKSINCQTGKVTKVLKLSQRFVERIHIQNGKVYYIYRPYESLQKKYIYSEEL